MPSIPLTDVILPPFHQGAQFEFGPLTFTVNSPLPDPNTWTGIRIVITPRTGGGSDVVLLASDSVTPPAISGTGPWTVVLYFPITSAQSASLPKGRNDWRLLFKADTDRDCLAFNKVTVFEMDQTEWP